MQQQQQFSYCEKYLILGKLEEGQSGKVKLGLIENQRVAIKLFKNDQVMIQEQEILEQLNHPNIIKMLDSKYKGQYKKKNGTIVQKSFIVFELSEAGELFYFIQSSGRVPEDVCRYYSKQLIESLCFMKQQKICHRDLKLNNIVLDTQYNIKIIDFGFAKFTNNQRTSKSFMGTSDYMAPEIWAGQLYNGFEVDVFATGVILFILYTGRPPFDSAQNTNTTFQKLIKNKDQFWNQHLQYQTNDIFSPDFKNLINGMIHPNPDERFTIEQCLQHQWLQGQMANHLQIFQEFTKRQVYATEAHELEREQQRKKKLENQQQQELRAGLDKPIGKFNSVTQNEQNDIYEETKQRYNLQFNNRKLKNGIITNQIHEIISYNDAEVLFCKILKESELFGGKVNKIYEDKYKINFNIHLRLTLISLIVMKKFWKSKLSYKDWKMMEQL